MANNGVKVIAVARAPRDVSEAVRFAAAIEPVTIGTWKLENTDESLPESVQPIIKAPAAMAESVFGEDNRQLVPDEHFAPGGKYRCMSKKL